MLLWILLLSALARPGNMAMWGNPGYDPDCDPKYKALSPRHTMCLTAGPGRLVPLAKDSILHYHNLLRTNTTHASDLFKVYWDDELAEVAAHWVAQCDQYGPHDDDRRVPSLPGVLIGQNMAYGHPDFESTVIQGWYREIRYFKYGVGATVEGAEVGHFEQLMSKDVYRIGCAQAQCANGPYYICNYAWGLFSHKPYTLGPQCSTCPLTCNTDKLCDCGGLVCKNGGKLLLDKCRCLCPWNALGEDCATLKCDGLICKNMGRLDLEKCQCVCSANFQGRDCGQEICSGKRCNNNGTLDKNTCQCVCQPHLSGEYCEKRECPIQDDDRCEKASKEQCEHLFIADAHLVKFVCPYKCGLCPMAEDAHTCQDDPSCTSFPNVLCKFHVQVGDKELQDLCPAKCQHC